MLELDVKVSILYNLYNTLLMSYGMYGSYIDPEIRMHNAI